MMVFLEMTYFSGWIMHMNVKMNASQGILRNMLDKLGFMSLVAHRFGRVEFEFQIFFVVFFRQEHFKKSKQIFNILNSTKPNQ